MKYFAIDFGSKRIGVAASNPEGTIAFPRTTVANDAVALVTLKQMAQEEKAEALVVGDTRTLSGAENPVTQAAETFAQKLAREAGLPLFLVREAGSTVGAGEISGTNHDDAAAAAYILQRYLDMSGSRVE